MRFGGHFVSVLKVLWRLQLKGNETCTPFEETRVISTATWFPCLPLALIVKFESWRTLNVKKWRSTFFRSTHTFPCMVQFALYASLIAMFM
jgi:hypothetical protein